MKQPTGYKSLSLRAKDRAIHGTGRVLRLGLGFGLVLTLAVATLTELPAAAAHVSSVTFVGSSQAAHATNTSWTVSFTTSSGTGGSLAALDTISVTFDSSFNLSGVSSSVTLGGGFSDCSATATAANPTVITLANDGGTCSLAGGTAATVTISGITNPGAGSYPASDFAVMTSKDTTAEHPSNPVVIGNSVSDVSFSPSTAADDVANATDTTWVVGFTTGSGALSSGSTITVVFNSAFGLPTSPSVSLASGFTSCTVDSAVGSGDQITITLTGGGCTVPKNTPVVVDISGITNPASDTYAADTFSVATSANTNPVSPAEAVTIGAAGNGAGTMTVSPTAVGVASTGNTLVFTYTATGGALDNGELEIAVAPGWSDASTTTTAAGYTTSTCGTVAVSSGTLIQVDDVTLAADGTCTITYGSEVSGGPGASAPSTAQLSTFSTYEESSTSGTLTQIASSPQVSVGTGLPTQIYGVDPIGTSIAISQAEFPTNGSAGAVVLARDDFFSDALAGGPLAAQVGGPLLLTEGAPISASIDPRTLAEIQRVLPAGGSVYILGGDLAISPNVDSALEAAGYNVVREAGTNEYDTAYLVAIQEGSPSTIFEATGTDFYDALSAVPAAIANHAAILLTDGNVQSYETGIYILSHPGITRYAVGGVLEAGGADPGATDIAGADLYSTSAAVAETFFPGATMYGAATSATFTDALGGGVYMATGGRSGPLLIVNPNPPLPSEILPYLASLPPGALGFVFGGPLAISEGVLTALEQAVG